MESNIFNLLDDDCEITTVRKRAPERRKKPAPGISASSKAMTKRNNQEMRRNAFSDKLATKLSKRTKKQSMRNKVKHS